MHVTEADIALFLENKLANDRAEAIRLHLADCDRCRDQVVAILRLPSMLAQSEPPMIDATVFERARELGRQKRRVVFPFRLFSPRLSFVVLVLAIGAVSYYILDRQSEPVRFRDRSRERPRFVLSPPEGATIGQAIPVLHWSPIANSVGYQVGVFRENGTLLWRESLKDTFVVLPGHLKLEAGKTYLWKVEVFLPDRSNFESGLHAFTYAPVQ